jgi:hypothetical protein
LSKPKVASKQEIRREGAQRSSSAQDCWNTPGEWRDWRATGARPEAFVFQRASNSSQRRPFESTSLFRPIPVARAALV